MPAVDRSLGGRAPRPSVGQPRPARRGRPCRSASRGRSGRTTTRDRRARAAPSSSRARSAPPASTGRARHDAEHQPVPAVGGGGHYAARRQEALHPVEVEALAQHLRDPAEPPGDLPEPVRPAPAQVAGAQLGDGAAARQVGRRLGVPQHHVGPGVDQLAGARRRRPAPARSERRPPGTGQPIAPGGQRSARPGGSTAIRAVASVWPYITTRSKPLRRAELGERADPLGGHPTAGLREVAQRRDLASAKPVRSSRSKVCGTPGKVVTPVRRHVGPERPVDDRASVSSSDGAGEQVGVQHREAVAVVQRQRGGGDVGRADPERRDDRLGVGHEAVGRRAGPAWASRSSRRSRAAGRGRGAGRAR